MAAFEKSIYLQYFVLLCNLHSWINWLILLSLITQKQRLASHHMENSKIHQ